MARYIIHFLSLLRLQPLQRFGSKGADGARTFGYDANGNLIKTEPVPTAVDLGLSVKWASCNLGASKPEEYGKYYAWADTKGYTQDDASHSFSWENTPHCKDPSNPKNSSSWDRYNSGDAKLEPADDAAAVNLGGTWRMPTQKEWQELYNECTWTQQASLGVFGYKVSSKKNNNWIFLPAAGYRNGTSYFNINRNGPMGYYWSSQVNSSDVDHAWYMSFDTSYRYPDFSSDRCRGFSVRPVCP